MKKILSLFLLILFFGCSSSSDTVEPSNPFKYPEVSATGPNRIEDSFPDTTLPGDMLAATPPMAFMSWNFFGVDITAKKLKETVDAMVSSGLVDAGYDYILIDDGWNDGRDQDGNIHPDPNKFPNGMKAFVNYAHDKGVRVGIYSDAAAHTCAGYEGSLGNEQKDANTFASWGIDFLKYDYCGAPADQEVAKERYKAMADALRNTGRDIVFDVCEWGHLNPWEWAAEAGGQAWRTTDDIRDAWKRLPDGDQRAMGIMDIVEINGELDQYAGPGHWNDPDMLIVGLYGNGGSSSDLVRGNYPDGCTDVEYQSQMSLWCLMAAPLYISCDVRNMNQATKDILMNKDIIAIDQDPLGRQAERVLQTDTWSVFVKPLSGGKYAVGVLNKSDKTQNFQVKLKDLGIEGTVNSFNVWSKNKKQNINKIDTAIDSHQTKVWVFSK